jgi:hypothetical protein
MVFVAFDVLGLDRFYGVFVALPLLTCLYILVMIAFSRIVVHEHKRPFCRNCGYNLRGVTRRCPECGDVFDESTVQ